MGEIAALCQLIEDVFQDIEDTRMGDVPILNPKLSVACIGLREQVLGGFPAYVGGLVTPWFINLIAVASRPDRDGVTGGARVTEIREHVFPSGTYPFLVCEEKLLGRFAMCSLFSPVQDFDDQAAALAVAEAATDELFDGDRDQTPSDEEVAVATMWQEGHWVAPSESAKADVALKDDPAPSRRAFITGGLSGEEARE